MYVYIDYCFHQLARRAAFELNEHARMNPNPFYHRHFPPRKNISKANPSVVPIAEKSIHTSTKHHYRMTKQCGQ